MSQRKILLIDDSAYIHRYYFAYKKIKNEYNGKNIEVGALHGLLEFTHKLKKEYEATDIIHILDPKNGSTYRKSFFPTYKDRVEKDDDLKLQIELLPNILSGYNQRWLQIEGIESDDIIAKMSSVYGKQDLVIMVAEDKDIWQNIDDIRTEEKQGIVCALRYSKNASGINGFSLIFSDFIFEKFGVQPYQISDLLAISGDKSDNIPGVKGIGNKTAVKLITNYGNVAGIVQALENNEIDCLTTLQLKNLSENIDDLILSKKLTLPFLDFDLPDISEIRPSEDYALSLEAKKIVIPEPHWDL